MPKDTAKRAMKSFASRLPGTKAHAKRALQTGKKQSEAVAALHKKKKDTEAQKRAGKRKRR